MVLKAFSAKKIFQNLDEGSSIIAYVMQSTIKELALQKIQQERKGSKVDALFLDKLIVHYRRCFVAYAPLNIAYFDKDQKFLAVSREWEKWFKADILENPTMQKNSDTEAPYRIVGSTLKRFAKTCPRPFSLMIKNVLDGHSIHNKEIKITQNKKSEKWMSFEAFPVYNTLNAIQGCIVVAKDITKLKNTFQRHKSLIESNDMLQNFSIIFSHDLLQPLRQISTSSEILSKKLKDKGCEDEEVEHLITSIESAIAQSKSLADGVIFYCKQGRFTANAENLSVNDVLKEMQARCFSLQHFTFNNMVSENVSVLMNSSCLWQLFQNLIANAIKHSTNSHPMLTLSARKTSPHMWEFTLHNDSSCPRRIVRHKVFEAFGSSLRDGAGLGLMICKKIVTAYKGSIRFKSSLKKGTQVVFTLPSAAET